MRSLRVLLAVLCMTLAGCRHKPAPAPIYFTPPKLTEALPLDETTLVPGTREVPLEHMERVPLKAIRIPRVRPQAAHCPSPSCLRLRSPHRWLRLKASVP